MNIDVDFYTEAVSGPGKFEGEEPETAYFYEQLLNGDGEQIGDYTLFVIEADEAETFNLTEGGAFVLYEDDLGFVYGKEFEDETEGREYVEKEADEFDNEEY